MKKQITIAMDGPVGAGKSSVADEVARRLGILHLDTGAMYRACGLCCLRNGVDPSDREAVIRCVAAAVIEVACGENGQRTLLNGEDVSGMIRTEAVSMAASTVAKIAEVRQLMVDIQRKVAASQPMLVDGRDICTRVLPDAPVKIYLTASAEERARRRFLELQKKGTDDTYEQVLADLKKRDEQDMNRETDPLRPAEDAVIVDTTGIDFEGAVQAVLRAVEEKQHE